MKYAAMILGFAMLLQRPAGAETTATPKGKSYGVGAAAGMVGGMGLSVEKWVSEKNALQLNIAPFYYEKKYPEDDIGYSYRQNDSGYSHRGFISLGMNFLHQIAEYRKFEVVTFAGGNFMGIYEDNDYFQSWQNWSDTGYIDMVAHQQSYHEENIVSLGGGFGAILNLWRFEGAIMVGIVGAYDWTNKLKRLTPSFDASLHFML